MSIATTLGIGSGLDTTALVDQLAAASRTPKDARLKTREEANAAKVSALATASNGIDAFATALSSLVSGGTLFTQPTVSDATVLGATAVAGARLGGLSAQVEVRQIAQAQSLVSATLAGVDAPVGQGDLTLTTATGSFTVTIAPGNDTLGGLVTAINAANAGVTAAIVRDAGGARLSLKGATGAAQAFTLATGAGADPLLARFAYDPMTPGGMTRAQTAENAIVRVDGVESTRTVNSIDDLIPGVVLDLKSAKPGTSITLGATRPTAAIKTALGDVVAAYNELKAQLDELTKAPTATTAAGALRSDPAVRELVRQLGRLPATILSGGGSYATLAEVGVRTERNGTLSLDDARLSEALAADPDAVEALFNPGQRASSPLISITSGAGRTRPGTYQLADLVAGPPASGTIAGVAAVTTGTRLIASTGSPASGLSIELAGNVASATVTVDLGLGGALKAIRDNLRAANGLFAASSSRFSTEAKSIADDRTRMEAREASYKDQLSRSFTSMDARVAAYKATQSFLEQQVALWTKDS